MDMAPITWSIPATQIRDEAAHTQANEEIVRRFYDGYINGAGPTALEDIVSVDFIDHVPALFPSQPHRGPTALEWLIDLARDAFPDLQVTVEEMIVQDETVVTRVTWRGTHRGEVFGIAPTHRPIRITGLDMIRLRDGLFVEHWGQLDFISMLDQLNYLPSFEEPLG
jgi:predicted ester cyclase